MFSDNTASSIRFPSSANLLIDSQDRNNLTTTKSTDFIISKNENTMAGYFTRFAICEVVINYSIPNISAFYDTNTLSITLGTQTEEIELLDGNYDVDSLMDSIKNRLNSGSDQIPPNPAQNLFPNIEFNWDGLPGKYNFIAEDVTNPALPNPQTFIINDTPLARMLRLTRNINTIDHYVINPYLMPPQLRYIDFVCNNITYQQGLKDAATCRVVRDVLYRWNFGWSEVYTIDAAGYSINQGYLPFVQRRYLSFPKQVFWNTTQPLGQLQFQLYNSDGKIIDVNLDTTQNIEEKVSLEWSMGVLVSEQ